MGEKYNFDFAIIIIRNNNVESVNKFWELIFQRINSIRLLVIIQL